MNKVKDKTGNIKYIGSVAGGMGDNIWDNKIEVMASNFKEAVDKIYATFSEDEDIVSLEQED